MMEKIRCMNELREMRGREKRRTAGAMLVYVSTSYIPRDVAG